MYLLSTSDDINTIGYIRFFIYQQSKVTSSIYSHYSNVLVRVEM
jgi:hypothetical protein